IVPWTTLEEYQQVYQWLYSEDPKQNELGVKRAKAWSARGKVPHAVVSTAAFVEVSLRDKFSSGKISNHELRLLYSMVFIRFVNGMVDPTQGSYASSVASLALKLNMPLRFVELRHAGTHEHLPSLQVLRNGCQQALQWLNENYWGIQRPLQSTHMDEIHSLLSKYKELRMKILKDSELDDMNSADKIVKKLLNLVSAEYVRDLLIPVLLEKGFLVPTEEKKRASMADQTLSKNLLDLWFTILRKFDCEWVNFGSELVQGMLEKLVIDEESVNREANLIQLMNFSPASDLIQQPKLIHSNSSYHLTLVAWISHILKLRYAGDFVIFAELDLENVLEFCLRKPNPYTKMVLQVMIDYDEELKTTVTPFMNYIVKMLNFKDNFNCDKKIPKITDDDMNREILELREGLSNIISLRKAIEENKLITDSSSESAWKMYDLEKWKECPIGCLPNGQIPCLDLSPELDGPNNTFSEPRKEIYLMQTDE
ncbi:6517_t:CDS:10, partial [Gigaspora rosea]